MKKLAAILFLLAFCAFVGKGWYVARDGLFLPRVLGWTENMELGWSEEIRSLLNQRFTFLGKGRQCYAFISEDGRYVAKIPRHDPFEVPIWRKALGLSDFSKREIRKAKILESFRIAYDLLKEESALITVHIPGGIETGVMLQVSDQLGRFYDLPLDRTGLILQHKKNIFRDLDSKLDRKLLIDQMLVSIARRARKGIMCRDAAFLDNYGFDEKGAYEIDIGTFYMPKESSGKEFFAQAFKGSLTQLRQWIKETDPDYAAILDLKIDAYVKQEVSL